MSMEKRVSGSDYLWCALYAAAGFAFELILVQLERLIGWDISTFIASQSIIHWCITIAVWILVGFIVIRIGEKTTHFDIWQRQPNMAAWQYAMIAVCFAVNIVSKYLDWDGFKIAAEWESRGPMLFWFQYAYYLAEAFLISLVIVYGQKACETWFGAAGIPYGGILLALVWGLPHILSKGDIATGLLAAFAGFLFGAVYLFVNKDYRRALPIIALLFIV